MTDKPSDSWSGFCVFGQLGWLASEENGGAGHWRPSPATDPAPLYPAIYGTRRLLVRGFCQRSLLSQAVLLVIGGSGRARNIFVGLDLAQAVEDSCRSEASRFLCGRLGTSPLPPADAPSGAMIANRRSQQLPLQASEIRLSFLLCRCLLLSRQYRPSQFRSG